MPQHDFIELHQKRFGKRLDTEERARKKSAREPHEISQKAQQLTGLKAKLFNKERFKEKVRMRKLMNAHEEKNVDVNVEDVKEGAVPTYLLDREQTNNSKVLTNMLKQKRKEKAGKWDVPIQKVKQLSEGEMFQVMKSGKRQQKAWKRKINKVCFVPETFTRKPPKYERYIRPTGLRFKKANVTHPELKTTFCLPILGVKKNPQSNLYTTLGVITKGTIMEVNVSELGLVTSTGKVIWSKYAQVMNNPELDGCINATLLV
ncbi:Ribosome biogenesis protein [Paramecium bursaria]